MLFNSSFFTSHLFKKKMNEIDHLDSFDVATITTAVSSISITAPAVEPSAIIRLNSCKGNEDIDDTIGIQDVSTVKVSPAKPSKVSKRTDNVICWDEYFMAIAFLSSMRSKDPSTQVGACIVNEDKRIVGIGYNGFPRGCRSVASCSCISRLAFRKPRRCVHVHGIASQPDSQIIELIL